MAVATMYLTADPSCPHNESQQFPGLENEVSCKPTKTGRCVGCNKYRRCRRKAAGGE